MLLDSLQTMSIIARMSSSDGIRPILKWAGGKQALAEFLVRQFPADIGVFYEPFLGGASVLLTLEPRRAIAGDLNDWLLDTYVAVRRDWHRVASLLDNLTNNKREFLLIRTIHPQDIDIFRRAAHLVYLNKTCFRGLFRVNRHGQFNVPYGAYKRRYYDPNNLKSLAECLRRVELRRGDFEHCVHDVSADDFVYFDPPYFKLGGYSDFNRYTPDQFRAKDHERLAALCEDLDRRGIRWAMTNSDTSFVRRLFRGFSIQRVDGRREINLNSARRDVSELLITNY